MINLIDDFYLLSSIQHFLTFFEFETNIRLEVPCAQNGDFFLKYLRT